MYAKTTSITSELTSEASSSAFEAASASETAVSIWQAISDDIELWLEHPVQNTTHKFELLSSRRLWRNAAHPPFHYEWEALKSHLLELSPDWRVWTQWYEARVNGTPTNDELEIARATIDEKDWEQGPEHVNRLFVQLEEKHGPLVAPDAQPDTAFWVPKVVTGKIDVDQIKAGKNTGDAAVNPAKKKTVRQKAVKGAVASAKSRQAGSASGDGRTETATAPPPKPTLYEDLALTLAEEPAAEQDFLNRSKAAFVLAARLNQIWDDRNPPQKKKSLYQRWCEQPKPPQSGFVVHIDAPWGGGKTSFTNYLTRILNPYAESGKVPAWYRELNLDDPEIWPEKYRRPWHVVQFNAWQHQHVSPPWWAFYDTIQKKLMWSTRSETAQVENENGLPPPVNDDADYHSAPRRWGRWLKLKAIETGWRVFTPQVQLNTYVTLSLLAAIFLIYQLGWTIADPKTGALKEIPAVEKTEGKAGTRPAVQATQSPVAAAPTEAVAAAEAIAPLPVAPEPPEADKEEAASEAVSSPGFLQYLLSIVAVVFGAGSFFRTLFSGLFNSLLPGTPEAAKNYSYGSNDPMNRFRAHFKAFLERFRRPVIVVVDDLDRCKPDFVVDLVRGMQTVLQSSRVVFVLLGDRDWIEQAFTQHHKEMKEIDVGPEHEFGARFVEKAIQLSFVLPDISPAQQDVYVRKILGHKESGRQFAETRRSVEFEILKAQTRQAVLTANRQKSQADSSASPDVVEAAVHEQRAAIQQSGTSAGEKAELEASLSTVAGQVSAVSETAIADTERRLVALAKHLPANPRQIIRIVNTISLFQEVARFDANVDPGSVEWQKLVRWLVLMIEWPKTWYTLSKYPALVKKVYSTRGGSKDDKLPDNHKALAAMIRGDKKVMALLDIKGVEGWQDGQISAGNIETFLKIIVPNTSGSLLQPKGVTSAVKSA